MDSQGVWIIPGAECLFIQQWQDAAILFYGQSGETHCLMGLSIELIKFLKDAPASTAELYKQICLQFDVDDEKLLEQQIEIVLGEFKSLGLIELLVA